MSDSLLIVVFLLIVGVLAVFVWIMRSVFRINEIVENQKKTIQLLAKIIELKKKEMGIGTGDKPTT